MLSCLGYFLRSRFIRRLPFVISFMGHSYLCRFISTIPRVTQIGRIPCFGCFFLVCCFIRFKKCVVISWLSVFWSCYQSGRSGAGLLNYTRYSVCDGVPWSAWLVAPLFPLISIFIDMFARKWARGPHNLARFPCWDPCITPGYWAGRFGKIAMSLKGTCCWEIVNSGCLRGFRKDVSM